MSGVVTAALDRLRSYTGGFAWQPLIETSRAAVLNLLQRIEVGRLLIKEDDNKQFVFGEQAAAQEVLGPCSEWRVRREVFWLRLALFADMGFAESYMLGEVDCPDLTAFFRIFILNRAQLSNATTWSSSISATVSGLLRRTNTLSNSMLNIHAHYDISNEMFAAFLSPDMTYSCPIWKTITSKQDEEETLEEAQIRKLDRFIDNAKIKKTDHVLEIGTGWGSFAIRAVQQTGCRVTSLTLSTEQKSLAEKRISQAGYADQIEVLICDYRSLPVPADGLYDKVVSIEMLEAVGREFLATYFGCVDKMLKPEGGIAVFQCITMPETRYEAYAKGEDFIQKYIFPGGHLPTVSLLADSMQRGTKGKLMIESIENIGGHYAKTLRLWKGDFMANFESRIRPALMREHVGMTREETDLFFRKWEYYFTYCEAGFNTKTLGDVIMTAGREGALEMLEGIPM